VQLSGQAHRHLDMKTLALAVLAMVLAGCIAPLPSATPAAVPTAPATPAPSPTPGPSPSPTIGFTCYSDPQPTSPVHSPLWLPSSYCPAEEVAVQTAVADLGYPVQRIDIVAYGGCGPFLTGPVACFVGLTGPAAYVTFSGTERVAVLTLALVPNGPLVATLEAFRVPPAGWSLP